MTCVFITVYLAMRVLLRVCSLFLIPSITRIVQCSEQAVYRRYKQKYLANHVLQTKQAESELHCGLLCFRHQLCASVNYKTSGTGKGRCELNYKKLDRASYADEEKKSLEFNHLDMIDLVSKRTHIFFEQDQTSLQEEFNCLRGIKHFCLNEQPLNHFLPDWNDSQLLAGAQIRLSVH